MATRWTIEGPRFDSRLGQNIWSKALSAVLERTVCTTLWILGFLHWELRRSEHEADGSTPSITEDGKAGSYAFTHAHVFSVDRVIICFIYVLSMLLCYFKVSQVYTVKRNTSNINKNTLHWRHVSAHIVAFHHPSAVISVCSRFAKGLRMAKM
jgi:hypothetical protein